MIITFVLFLVVVGTLVFHFWSPWWLTPLASNWGGMDETLLLTFWVTGGVFMAVGLFMVGVGVGVGVEVEINCLFWYA